MCCPRCGSGHLRIRLRTGFERLVVFLTNKRKYRCEICEHIFRMPDRRTTPRVEAGQLQRTSQAASSR